MARRRPPDQLDRLLDAAMRVFARKGLHEARMSDVAEEMGVSQGTVYNCVRSKEALFYLLLTRGAHNATPSQPELPVRAPSMKEILTRLEHGIAETFALPRLDAALAQRPPRDAGAELEGIVRELYERTAATRQAADVVERSAVDLPPMFALFFVKVRRGLMARLTRYVQARVEAGALRPVRDAEVAGRFILETVTTFARHRHRDPDPQPMDDRVVTDTIVDLVVASLVPS